jgi:hypothetical protein
MFSLIALRNQNCACAARLEPFICYHLNQSSMDFTVILRAQRFVDNYLIKHGLSGRSRTLPTEGIVIPFPIRTVHFKADWAKDGTVPVRQLEEILR